MKGTDLARIFYIDARFGRAQQINPHKRLAAADGGCRAQRIFAVAGGVQGSRAALAKAPVALTVAAAESNGGHVVPGEHNCGAPGPAGRCQQTFTNAPRSTARG